MTDVQILDSLDALPGDALSLFAEAPFQLRPEWWRSVQQAALPSGGAACFVLCREAGRPLALVPLLLRDDGAQMSSLCTPYTIGWQPIVAAEADAAMLARAGAALGRACGAWPVLRWDALDAGWRGLSPLLTGMRRSGYRAARFLHFGNWHEPVEGLDWAAYLAARPGALRETIRRKQARARRVSGLQLDCLRSPCHVRAATAAYLDVYRRSWKQPEPYPDFDAVLLRQAAESGMVRLGVLSLDGVALAAQYWTVAQGVATVMKLAHDRERLELSPGTLLTAWMVRLLLEEGGIRSLDFGRGDDLYKRLWTSRRRQRIGVILADAKRPTGAAALARQWAGQATRRWRQT